MRTILVWIPPVRLSELPKGALAVVERVLDAHAADPIAQRLRDLGFVDGEPVRVVAVGPSAVVMASSPGRPFMRPTRTVSLSSPDASEDSSSGSPCSIAV